MSISYKLEATIVDIRSDTPQNTDQLLVDTNVWLWMCYSRASQNAHPYQANTYPHYLSQALQAKARLFCASLAFAEIAHVVEKTEREVFNSTQKTSAKEFRHNFPQERQRVIQEISNVWQLIQVYGTSFLASQITDAEVQSAQNALQLLLVDGYDLFIVQAMQQAAITSVLTDDGDFATVPGATVFTANHNLIKAAQKQGKLLIR